MRPLSSRAARATTMLPASGKRRRHPRATLPETFQLPCPWLRRSGLFQPHQRPTCSLASPAILPQVQACGPAAAAACTPVATESTSAAARAPAAVLGWIEMREEQEILKVFSIYSLYNNYTGRRRRRRRILIIRIQRYYRGTQGACG